MHYKVYRNARRGIGSTEHSQINTDAPDAQRRRLCRHVRNGTERTSFPQPHSPTGGLVVWSMMGAPRAPCRRPLLVADCGPLATCFMQG